MPPWETCEAPCSTCHGGEAPSTPCRPHACSLANDVPRQGSKTLRNHFSPHYKTLTRAAQFKKPTYVCPKHLYCARFSRYANPSLGFRVEGWVEGSGFRVEGCGFRVEALGFPIPLNPQPCTNAEIPHMFGLQLLVAECYQS